MEINKYNWIGREYELIDYGRNNKALGLSLFSFVLPLDFGLFAGLGVLLSSPIKLRYRAREKLREIKRWWALK